MQEALGNYPILFGLVRLPFSKEDDVRTKWVFVQVSNRDDDESGFSMRERGQANMKASQIFDVVKKLAVGGIDSKIEIHSKADCTLGFVLASLQSQQLGDFYTEENYNNARKQEQEKLQKEQPEVAEQMQKQEEREKIAEEMKPPPAEEPVLDMAPEEVAAASEVTRQRKSIRKIFKVGDPV